MRVTHKTTDSLSAEGWRLMAAGFREKLTAKMIAARIEQGTGEKIAERTVSRRYREWVSEQARRRSAKEQMLALIEASREGDYSAAEMINALATDALMMNPNGFADAAPLKVQAQNLKAEELRIKRADMEVRRRAVEVQETRLRLLEAREQRALTTLEKPDAEMTPEERVREIQAIYGIHREANGQ